MKLIPYIGLEFLFLQAQRMKKILLLGVFAFALLIGFLVNSCKKSTDYLPTLLTNGKWQLASVMVFNYVGPTLESVDTLNTNCNLTQVFQFNTNNTCSYTNFDCLAGTSGSGTWSFSTDHLYLHTTVVCKDTTAAGSSIPFQSARIINLGQFSLVLQTGYLQTYYSPTQVRQITQYGFVKVKTQ